jgi:sRNA-binding regulator protein Hfq
MSTANRSRLLDSRRANRGTIAEFRGDKKPRRNGGPSDSTNAENFYYLKQMSARTPMVVVLTDGEQIHGWIEWYDRDCLKINRHNAPNLLVPKRSIKYLFKEAELNR